MTSISGFVLSKCESVSISFHFTKIWDIAIKRMRAILKGHNDAINDVVFSPNSHSLVSGSFDRTVRIWNIRDGSSKVLPLTGSPEIFLSVVFSPDGRYIAAGNHDGSLWIWNSRTHRLLAKWWGHTYGVWCTVFTPDGKGLISGDGDRTAKYWDVSLLGNRQGVPTERVVDEEDGFPLIRSFLGHRVRFFSLLSSNVGWKLS